MDKQLEQAVRYFKNEPAYHTLFILFKRKYKSLGRIGGTVTTQSFSAEELETISKFFGIPSNQLHAKETISLSMFEKQLTNTRFYQINLKQLLDAYFGKVILSNKEHQIAKKEKLDSFLHTERKKHPILRRWFDFLLTNHREGRWIIRLAEYDPISFQKIVASLSKALSSLPRKAERLPMFSQRITGDPHAFDLDQIIGKMFLHVLCVMGQDEASEIVVDVPTDTESINHLLNEHHIYRDDLLNFVTVTGLYAENQGGIHKVWDAAVEQRTVQLIPLRELVSLKRVYPAEGTIVWAVENSGVCSVLLDEAPDTAMICANGQFTLAAFLLLDLLVEDGNVIQYAGDLDPEGISIAQRLLKRYPNNVRLWHMDKQAYKDSNPVKEISNERLEKLNAIHHPALQEVAAEMRKVGKAGYQEALVEKMKQDLQSESVMNSSHKCFKA